MPRPAADRGCVSRAPGGSDGQTWPTGGPRASRGTNLTPGLDDRARPARRNRARTRRHESCVSRTRPVQTPEPSTIDTALAQIANLERERRVAEALLQVETLDLHTVVDRICRLTVDLMPCDRATAYLYSARARGFVPVADCGTPPEVVQRFAEKFYFGQSRAGGKRSRIPFRDELVAGRLGHATRDDATDPETRELLEALGQYAVCLAPLRSTTRGAIFVSVGQPPGFDETAVRILEGVGRQASNLTDHARMFQTLQHAARVRAGLASLAAAVNLETDPLRIARLVSAEAATLFRIDAVAVLVPKADGLAVVGDHGLSAEGRQLPLGDETVALVRAFREGTLFFAHDRAGRALVGGPPARRAGGRAGRSRPTSGRSRSSRCRSPGETARSAASSSATSGRATRSAGRSRTRRSSSGRSRARRSSARSSPSASSAARST